MTVNYAQILAPLGLPIGWDDEGKIYGRENLTPEQNAAVDAAIASYDPEKESIKLLSEEIRYKRNTLIAKTDFLVMADYPIEEERKQKVLAYRQALRDITSQETFPQSVIWPVLE